MARFRVGLDAAASSLSEGFEVVVVFMPQGSGAEPLWFIGWRPQSRLGDRLGDDYGLGAMRYSPLVTRLYNDSASGWEVHIAAFAAKAAGEDVIILSVGDPDFETPAPIVESCVEALRAGDTHYNPILGRPELRAAVAADMADRTGMSIGLDNVLICAGTQNALIAASLCLLGDGDEVIGLDPMYLTYEATLRIGGASAVRVAQPAASGFRPDPEVIEAAVTDRTRAIAITTPNNPTGVVLRRAELEDIAEIARANDLWVIADEVYGDVVFDGAHLSIAALPGMAERTVTVGSLSKSHAMTGWRVGWAIGPEELIRHCDALQVNVNYGLPGFIQAAALTALTVERAASTDMTRIYRRRRDLAAGILAKSSRLDVLVPDAGMYLLVGVSKVAPSSAAFVRGLFEATGVSVLDAKAFGECADGWVRVSFTIGDDELAEGCRRLVNYAAG